MRSFKIVLPICIIVLITIGIYFQITETAYTGILYWGKYGGQSNGTINSFGVYLLAVILIAFWLMGLKSFKDEEKRKLKKANRKKKVN
ncbi:MAG: hypothetical protein JST82_05440 [Bacteroidetes bacterium]|nr:hypothetical protein [Bacteroidota bacterium]